jgi:hypothetical protein
MPLSNRGDTNRAVASTVAVTGGQANQHAHRAPKGRAVAVGWTPVPATGDSKRLVDPMCPLCGSHDHVLRGPGERQCTVCHARFRIERGQPVNAFTQWLASRRRQR